MKNLAWSSLLATLEQALIVVASQCSLLPRSKEHCDATTLSVVKQSKCQVVSVTVLSTYQWLMIFLFWGFSGVFRVSIYYVISRLPMFSTFQFTILQYADCSERICWLSKIWLLQIIHFIAILLSTMAFYSCNRYKTTVLILIVLIMWQSFRFIPNNYPQIRAEVSQSIPAIWITISHYSRWIVRYNNPDISNL